MQACKDCSADRAPGRSRCYPCYGAKRKAKNVAPADGMKVLYLDIETTPMNAWVWGSWQQNVYIDQIVDAQRTMCFSAKWAGGDNQFFAEWDEGGHAGMVEAAHDLLNQADAVVHYYGSKFDIPHLNTEFLKAGMAPPSPYKQIDLKLAVSKNFKFPSNKLQYVSTLLGLAGKHKTDMDLWLDCMKGDRKQQKYMEKYNRQDVDLLEDLFARLLPWVPQLPNRNLYDEHDYTYNEKTGAGKPVPNSSCPFCGSDDVVRSGFYFTALSKFKQYQCRSCEAYLRASKREVGVGLQSTVLF